MAPVVFCLLVLGIAPFVTGCGATLRTAAGDLPRIAVPVGVDALLDSFEDPAVRERVARIMATPEMQHAAEELGAAVTRGALEAASSEEAKARVGALSIVAADAFTRDVARGLSPDQALGRALTDVAARATHNSLQAAAEEIPVSLGPAIEHSLAAELRTPELRQAIAETVADVTRETLVKSSDVIAQMHAQPHPPGLMERVDRLLSFAWLLALSAAAGGAVLFARALGLHRRLVAIRLDGAAELAERTLSAAQGKAWSPELRELLAEQVRNAEAVSRAREGASRAGQGPRWPWHTPQT